MSSGLAALILQGSDKRRVPWPTKLLRLVLRQWKSIMVLKLRYTTRVYTQAQQILVCLHNGMETIVDFKQSNRPKKRRMDRRLLSCKLHATPWPTTTSTAVRSSRELSWYARLTYITKNLK